MEQPKRQRVSNEKLCAALIVNNSVKATAKALGLSERTIYNRLNDYDFRIMYQNAKADILKESVDACQRRTLQAVECIAEIMNDRDINAQTRLLAAQTILKNAVALHDGMERIRAKADEEWG